MSEERAVEKTMLTQSCNPRNRGSPMESGEKGIPASLKARRTRLREALTFLTVHVPLPPLQIVW
jgi:hypothetical protein